MVCEWGFWSNEALVLKCICPPTTVMTFLLRGINDIWTVTSLWLSHLKHIHYIGLQVKILELELNFSYLELSFFFFQMMPFWDVEPVQSDGKIQHCMVSCSWNGIIKGTSWQTERQKLVSQSQEKTHKCNLLHLESEMLTRMLTSINLQHSIFNL